MRVILFLCILLTATASFGQVNIPEIYHELDKAYQEEDYQKILDLKDQALAILQPRQDSVLVETYSVIGDAFYSVGDLENAADLFNQARELLLLLGKNKSEEYSSLLYNLIFLYNELGQYDDALGLGNELLALDKEHFGGSSEEYLSSVVFFTDVLVKKGDFSEARKVVRQAMRGIDQKHKFYPVLLNKEADIHSSIGHYTRAEKRFIESLSLIEASQGTNSATYASVSANLANMYGSQGKYPQAEKLLLHATEILKNSEELPNSEYINSLNNLALVHLSLNQEEKAIQELNQVLEHDKRVYGENHPYLALTLSNIGTAYNDMDRFEEAEAALERALAISEAHMGKKSISYAVDANNLASMYRLSGYPEKAVPLYKESLAVFKEALGKKDPDYIKSLYNLGLTNFILESKDAKKLLRTSLKRRKRLFSDKHPAYAESAEKLAYWYWHSKRKKRAKRYFNDVFESYFNQIDTYFPALSEDEKVNYFSKKIKVTFEAFNNFVNENHHNDPDLLDEMLDNQLNTKALIMYATNKVRESIYTSGDSVLIHQYEEWLGLKESLSKLFSSQDPANDPAIDSLKQQAELLEKEIGRKSASFTETYLKQRVSWKDLKAKLNDGEAVIEIIRFRGFNPSKGGVFTDDIFYAGLMFTRDSEHPVLIDIPDGRLMEERYIKNYRNAIQFKITDEYSYNKLWKPISEHLQGIEKVFFSPDGVYNQVNINTLYNPETGNYLLNEMDVRVLTNSKDLLSSTAEESSNNNHAFLLGYPMYNLNMDESDSSILRRGMRGARSENTTEGLTRGLNRGVRAGLLRYMRGEEGISLLPGTKIEVENISRLYNGTEVNPTLVLNEKATEYFIKGIKSPKTLHIATHGFFLPDVESYMGESNKYVENPLLRSGLILAGAGDFLLSGAPVDSTGQDGILTAYEAMNLNLDDTQLVVLSACETGLGEIKNGEGVYGLQRAFFIAGTDNLIMSMWSVDDDATQELMSTFYAEWINSKDKRQAFRKAQQLLKAKYKDPFYWGAFIMVGV